jgi:protein mraZ
MFMGEFNHNVDAKGRAIVPSKFREELGEKFIVTKGMDGCLFLYTMTAWEAYVEKLSNLPTTNPNARRFVRIVTSGASECEPDGNGRIMIPANLREFAGITKEIVTIGANDRVEIWDKQRWADYNGDGDFDDEMIESMAEFGI